MLTRLLKGLLFMACLLSFNASNSQTIIPGFTYMGVTADGHAHYRSTDQYTWPAANTKATCLGGYITTINDAAENLFILNNLPSATQIPPKEVHDYGYWIGFNNTVDENPAHWTWANGEPVTYVNWRQGNNGFPNEPNDNWNSTANDISPAHEEDYAEIYPRGLEQSIAAEGTWNDWKTGSSLQFVLEFNTTNPTLPAPGTCVTTTCGLTVSTSELPAIGCGSANTIYIGYGPQSVTATSNQAGTTFQWFMTNNPNAVASGATFTPTMPGTYYVVGTNGSCTASTMGSATQVTVIDVRCDGGKIKVCHKVNGNGNGINGANAEDKCVPESAVKAHLDHGDCLGACAVPARSGNSISARENPLLEGAAGLSIRALSNPANGFFNIQVGTASAEKVTFKVMDMQGKLIEQRQNVAASQNLIFGNNYRPGIYFVEVMQGAERKQLKLVKAN